MKHQNFPEENLFSTLQTYTLPSVGSDQEETLRVRDIDFVITERKLERLNPTALSKFLEPLSLKSESSTFQMSDKQLFDYCQSRYIQQPSDVQAYSDYLIDKAQKIKDDYKTKSDQINAWKEFISNFASSKEGKIDSKS